MIHPWSPNFLASMAYTWYRKEKKQHRFGGVVKKSTQTHWLRWVEMAWWFVQGSAKSRFIFSRTSSPRSLWPPTAFASRRRFAAKVVGGCYFCAPGSTSGLDTCIEFSDMNGIRTLNIPKFNHFQTFHRWNKSSHSFPLMGIPDIERRSSRISHPTCVVDCSATEPRMTPPNRNGAQPNLSRSFTARHQIIKLNGWSSKSSVRCS